MAWVFEKSPAWRRIVAKSRESPAFYASFAAACFVVPYGLGKAVMWATNPEVARKRDVALQAELRGRQTYHHEVSQTPACMKDGLLITILHHNTSVLSCGKQALASVLQSLAKANRARLAVLLGEMKNGTGSEDRWEAALRGESLGTHSRGTTVGAQSIKNAAPSYQKQ